jgi:hypothetical protein
MGYSEKSKLNTYIWRFKNIDKHQNANHEYYLKNIDKFKRKANKFHSYNLWRKKLMNINLF